MMEKLLSIVIPTYNMGKLLPRCIDSLVYPKYDNRLEVLIVNDGSTDNSLEIAKKYVERYPEILRVIDKENGNYGSAVNRGISEASGKYFRILDADDYYYNAGLMEFIEKLDSTETDAVLTNYRRDKGDESILFGFSKSVYGKILRDNEICLKTYPNYKMHALTYRTSILKNNSIRLQEGISYTDSEFCFYPLNYVKSIIAYNILVYCYQIGRVGQTIEIASQLRSIKHMEKICTRMFNTLCEVDIRQYSLYSNLRTVYCDICSLALMTILCFDKTHHNLDIVDNLMRQIILIDGAEAELQKKHLYGIKYFNRYRNGHKESNGVVMSMWYAFIRQLTPFYSTIRRIIR